MMPSWNVDYIVDYFHFGETIGYSITLNYSYEINNEWLFESATKPVGNHKRKETSERMSLFFWCGDFAARKPRPPAAALDMAPTPGQKRRRFRVSFFIILRG